MLYRRVDDSLILTIRERLLGYSELDKKLYSLILYGSIVRGDFIPNVSDIDFFAVILDDKIIPVIRNILEICCSDTGAVEVDLAWESLENIRDPLNKGYPFKFLTVYQDDFSKFHIVIYGKDIVDDIPRYDSRSLIRWRCEFTLKNLYKNKDNLKMLHIIAGETIRFIAWLETSSLHKDDVIDFLKKSGDKEALDIYLSYLGGRLLSFDRQYLVDFVRDRVAKILETF
jgi:predicted nucleotidyltransferase